MGGERGPLLMEPYVLVAEAVGFPSWKMINPIPVV